MSDISCYKRGVDELLKWKHPAYTSLLKNVRNLVINTCSGIIPTVMDYSGDCIMDYQLWSLRPQTDCFVEHVYIPLTKTAQNVTNCSPWLVGTVDVLNKKALPSLLSALQQTTLGCRICYFQFHFHADLMQIVTPFRDRLFGARFCSLAEFHSRLFVRSLRNQQDSRPMDEA